QQTGKKIKKYIYPVEWDILEGCIDQGIIGKKLNKEDSYICMNKIKATIDKNHFLYSGYYRKVLFLLLKTKQYQLLLQLKKRLNK
ncbi:MAG: hypothetical protein L0G39_09910, partial [Chryseobacterium sp.]|nr:hypothetical protein [Chryseobacterium sp.]